MFLGLVGPMGGGKSTVVEMTGFKSVSLTDVLKKEAKKREVSITRNNLINLGNKLRAERGEHVLAEMAFEEMTTGNHAIDSIRNPNEVGFLREKLPRFFLVAVDAPSEVRWRRSKEKYESLDEEGFEEIDKRDRDIGIDRCMNMADFYVENVDLEETLKEVNAILSKRKVVGLVGMPGSGKSLVQRIFARSGFDSFNMGDIVTEIEFAKRGYEKRGEGAEKEIADSLRKELGEAAVAIRTFEELKNVKGDLCIAGIRSKAEADLFRERWGKSFVAVAVGSSFETRLERLKKRKERPYKSEEGLRRRDEREIGYGLGELLESCQLSLENESSVEELESRAVSFIKTL